MRTVTVPRVSSTNDNNEPEQWGVSVLDPDTDKPTGAVLQWATFVRILFLRPRLFELAAHPDLDDLRQRLLMVGPDGIDLDETPWNLLCELVRHPLALQPTLLTTVRPLVHAVLHAPTKSVR